MFEFDMVAGQFANIKWWESVEAEAMPLTA